MEKVFSRALEKSDPITGFSGVRQMNTLVSLPSKRRIDHVYGETVHKADNNAEMSEY
jgi:hypothetical protein